MLNFFRKYQRIFFIVITVTIVVSFSFFGTYSTFGNRSSITDREVVRGVCGVPIMQQELAALCRLIDNSHFDRSSIEKGGMPNFLNDGVVEKDFLANGLAVMLAKRYFDELKTDLEIRTKKIHHYRPYVHPRTTQISAEGVWARFSPSLLEHFRLLKEKSVQPTTEVFALMSQLYLEQANLPGDMLKQILMMQQNQSGIQPDPVLANTDLALYGFKSMEDWFGSHFILMVGQFIANAAQLAEQKGYEIKAEEIRAELFQNIYQGYRQFSRNAPLKAEEVEQYYQMKTRQLGFSEATLMDAWKKVMLFRRLFEDGSGSILIDPLAYQQFDKFAKENVHVILYQLPQSLQLSDFCSMLKLQLYLEAVTCDSSRLRNDLRIPKQFASLEQIEKRTPELIERRVEIEWTGVSKEELSRSISIKETWEWEATQAHWDLLKVNFPELTVYKPASAQEILALLDKLDQKLRTKIDQFARLKMIEQQTDKIKLALETSSPKKSTLGLKMRGTVFPFEGIKDSTELGSLLEDCALKDEPANTANHRLSYYTSDEEHYYHIQVIHRENEKKIITFAEALRDGTLDKLLDKRLEETYPDIRKRHAQSFQQNNGQWKPFREVRDLIGKYLFADLLKSIEDNYRTQFGMLPGKEGELPLTFYSSVRLMAFMQDIQSRLQSNPTDTSWIRGDGEGNETALSSQWLIEKTEKVMERCTEASFSKEEMFTLAPEQWSPVKVGEKGALTFYKVQGKNPAITSALESIEQGHQILSFDAKRDMMLQILQKIQYSKSIDLSVSLAEEK